MDRLLSLERYSVDIEGEPVIRAIDLEVGDREVVGLVGPGGAGKSTLVGSICRPIGPAVEIAVRGGGTFCGERLRGTNRPEQAYLPRHLARATLFEYLTDGHPRASGLARRDLVAHCHRTLEAYRLTDLVDRLEEPVISLTRPQRVRATLLRASLGEPELICIDEPFGEMPSGELDRLQRLLGEMADEHALLVATRSEDRLGGIADRIFHLQGGMLYRPVDPLDVPMAM
jgi:ABC-type multidrug transport system ATPase subunit